MLNSILIGFFSAIVAIGLTDVLKKFFTRLPSKVKTVIGVVVTILVATFFGIVDNLFNGLPAITFIFRAIFIDVVAVGFVQFGYNYCVKVLDVFIKDR